MKKTDKNAVKIPIITYEELTELGEILHSKDELSEIQNLFKDIDKLKKNLNQLIEVKGFNLQDQEVIKASQELNDMITKYNELITKKL